MHPILATETLGVTGTGSRSRQKQASGGQADATKYMLGRGQGAAPSSLSQGSLAPGAGKFLLPGCQAISEAGEEEALYSQVSEGQAGRGRVGDGQVRREGRTGKVLPRCGFAKAGESHIRSDGWRTASEWSGKRPGNPTRETYRGQITTAKTTTLVHTNGDFLWGRCRSKYYLI